MNCYNVGIVTGEANNISGVGGIVGFVSVTETSGEISHNYSSGNIQINATNVTNVRGAIGRYASSNFTINHNYYETGKSNVTLVDNASNEGKSASDMKTQAFVNLLNEGQETAVWEINGSNNGYPVLK